MNSCPPNRILVVATGYIPNLHNWLLTLGRKILFSEYNLGKKATMRNFSQMFCLLDLPSITATSANCYHLITVQDFNMRKKTRWATTKLLKLSVNEVEGMAENFLKKGILLLSMASNWEGLRRAERSRVLIVEDQVLGFVSWGCVSSKFSCHHTI